MTTQRHINRALTRLRQMACLDTGGPEQIASVLSVLHQVIGFNSGGYVYSRSDGELDVFMENPALQAAMPDYFEPHILRSEQQVLFRSSRQFGEAVRKERGVLMLHQLVKVSQPELQRSDFYNVILRPGGVEDGLSLALRTPQGQGIGILKLYRCGGERPFSLQDAAALGQLETCLARALQTSETDALGTEVSGQGLVIVSPTGKLEWIAKGTDALLAQAFGSRWRDSASDLPSAMHLLLQRLWLPMLDAPLPKIAFRNAHGWFSLHATGLTDATGQREAAAIHVIRRVAIGTRLLEHLQTLGLPRRQMEMAYWMARGLSELQVAERMGISLNTVAYHRQLLYASLGVQNRKELIGQLSAANTTQKIADLRA